jgi:putative iron-dependent peroxidase
MSTNGDAARGPQPQAVAAPLTSSAIFLVVTVNDGADSERAVRALCDDLPALVRAVGFRETAANLSCVTGFGAQAWERLFGDPTPAGLHPFQEIHADDRHAVSTPGDLIFHIRAMRMDLCFELATQITTRLTGAVSPVDETHGFRFFDDRDLIGFVDGTENPTGDDAVDATVIGAEDPGFAGGSYVVVQKYLHDLAGWNAVPTEQQELIIGREKLSDIELSDEAKPSYAHNVLTSITDENGDDIDIIRDNMPFGVASRSEQGTYFIGYANSPEPIERMLDNMFVGDPPGNYDRLLDFSTAVTGSLFFVPSVPLLAELADRTPARQSAPPELPSTPAPPVTWDGTLDIGSLRGASQHE